MNKRFSSCFKVVATVHVAVVAAVLLASTWQGCVSQKKEVVMPVAFVVEAPAAPSPVEYVQPDPIPLPKPVPVKPPPPPPKPDPKPVAKKKPPRKRKPIKVSDEVINRSIKKPRAKPLSEKEIRKALEAGAKLGNKTSIPNDEGKCLGRIHYVLYRAWVDRPSADGVEGAVPEVMFRFSDNGSILSRELVKRSGNSIMDDSVMRAARAVTRISGLSKDFLKRHRYVITVTFSLE